MSEHQVPPLPAPSSSMWRYGEDARCYWDESAMRSYAKDAMEQAIAQRSVNAATKAELMDIRALALHCAQEALHAHSEEFKWNDIEAAAPREGSWCLCYCRIPAVIRNGITKRREQFRYLVLEYADGDFWVNRGAPQGFVLRWQYIKPVGDMPIPEIHGRRVKRQQQPEPASAACNSSEGKAE